MMRAPTDPDDALSWWRAASADISSVDIPLEPQCGLFRMKTTRVDPQSGRRENAGWRPVEISLESVVDDATGELTTDEQLVCTIDGRRVSATELEEQWPWFAGNPITPAAFEQLQGFAAFARDAGRSIDLRKDTVI